MVGLGGVDGGGELALQAGGDAGELVGRRHPHHQGGGAEDLLLQRGLGGERLRGGREDRRLPGRGDGGVVLARRRPCRRRRRRTARATPSTYDAWMPAFSIGWAGQPGTASATAVRKASSSGPSTAKTRPGLVHSWPTPTVRESTYAWASPAGSAARAPGSRKTGLMLDISAYTGIGTGRAAAACMRATPAGARAGEADRLDVRVRDQRDADLPAGAEDHREDALGQAVLLDGPGDRAGDQLGGAGVGRVGLDHDGAAGGERGGGVTARDGEGQREVAGTEDRDRAQRDPALADVGTGERCAVRQRRVDPGADPAALADQGGEQAQLVGGAGQLAADPRLDDAGLALHALDEGVAEGVDVVGDLLEERAALLGAGLAVDAERLARERGGPGDVLAGAEAVGRVERLARCGGRRRAPRRRCRRPGWRPGTSVRSAGGRSCQITFLTRSVSSASSALVRSVSGGRTGPAGCPAAVRPALTMDTP